MLLISRCRQARIATVRRLRRGGSQDALGRWRGRDLLLSDGALLPRPTFPRSVREEQKVCTLPCDFIDLWKKSEMSLPYVLQIHGIMIPAMIHRIYDLLS